MNETAYQEAERALFQSVGCAPTVRLVSVPELAARLRVLEFGEGPPVLFLHSGLSASAVYATLASRWHGFRCILVDRPGCGLGDPIRFEGSVRATFRRMMVTTVDALELSRVHVVGCSFGSYCGLLLAMGCPDRVGRMVHFGCPALVPGMTVRLGMRLLAVPGLNRILGRLVPATPAAARRQMTSRGRRPGLPEEFIAWWVSLMRDTDTLPNELDLFERILSLAGTRRSERITADEMRTVVAPSLLCWGDSDAMGTVETGRRLADLMPTARLRVVPGGGHLPWLHDLEAVAEEARAFPAAG